MQDQLLQLTLYNQKSEEEQRRTEKPTAEQLLQNWHLRPNINKTIWLKGKDIFEVMVGNQEYTAIVLLESGGMYEVAHTKQEIEEMVKLARLIDHERGKMK